jgi:2-dehydro-3-deoxyphosphogluconate aldolase/(4S)-4-hydroxy-2-oxoglutarate aldolase
MAGVSAQLRTIAILRGYDPARTREIATRAWAAGIDLVEVPVQDPSGWKALEAIATLDDRGRLGVGTVFNPADVARAADLGCSVIISPGLDPAVVDTTLDAGLFPLPGVHTASEVTLAIRLGLDTVKLFPAETGGPRHLKALLSPFPRMRFIAVGGIDADNAARYFRAGAAGVAFGSSIEAVLSLPDAAAAVDRLHKLRCPEQ